MIVQSAAEGAEHFVITMDQHTALCARFAEHFGNEQFEPVEPRALMLHVIEHHDIGWRDLDAQALRDPATGLPYNLVKTPFANIVETSSASPDANSEHHPYCGLMSSMHSWGLYNGRYGMSDKVLLDSLADDNRALADAMLEGEIERQKRLRTQLESDPETASLTQESRLFQNYKQLQFFDTLALYFNCVHEGAREEASFSHVPLNASEDTEVAIKPVETGVYALDPYPFDDAESIELSFTGRYLSPVSQGDDVREELERVPVTTQTFTLLAAA
ncbi:MAG: DUF3891 family protein [Gammaproteobacteria bacterium]|nr:DUF3891 family protein [Gammaproteobacteria bacterium]MDE0511115.1 DUF3891 family protein [Gammaproteobacteria bacterium]